MPRPKTVLVLAVTLVVLVVGLGPVGLAAAAGPDYVAPVSAPVVDPFRAPSHPYGPGNRGIEYRTRPGTVVRAAADGRVTFTGLVAGRRHVTVAHADGIRTTYSHLEAIRVIEGQTIRQRAAVGIAGRRLHVGARLGDRYLDPAGLWGRSGRGRVHLVPLDGARSGAGAIAGRLAAGQVGSATIVGRSGVRRVDPTFSRAHLRSPPRAVRGPGATEPEERSPR